MNNVKVYTCNKKCCNIYINEDIYNTLRESDIKKSGYRKAGICLYDPENDSVLLVQSYGHLWGFPKGTLDEDESDIKCAVRELKEETGIDLDGVWFSRKTRILKKAVFFYLEIDKCLVSIQDGKNLEKTELINKINDTHQINDANGITWIKIKCLEECIRDGHMVLNYYGKTVFSRFLNKTFQKSEWKKVKKRKRKTV